MCLVVIGFDCHPRYRLILAGNRDEFHDRPAAPLAWWDDVPAILAGRDLAAGGTWLGLDHRGRLAVITNFRDPAAHRPEGPSRGTLIPRFLSTRAPATAFAADISSQAADMSGFNLLLFDGADLALAANQPAPAARRLQPGVYGLSNHRLDTPWPKLRRAREQFARLVAQPRPTARQLTRALRDRQPADDHELPDTGLGMARERLLSAPFIVDPAYGTRCTTVVLMGRDGSIEVEECRYGRDGEPLARTAIAFQCLPAER